MLVTPYALCSFKFFKLKTEGQTTKQTISPKIYRTEIKILTIQPGLGDDTDRMISGILTLVDLIPGILLCLIHCGSVQLIKSVTSQ